MATEPIVSKLLVENGNGSAVTGVEAAERTALAPAISNGVGAQPTAESAPSILAGGDSASGHWVIRGDGEVLGEFTGEIDCAGTLVIGRGAVVSAIIHGNDVVIAGLVRGNLVARAKLRIASSGRLEGDARVGALVVMEGGVHHGVIRVHPEGVPEEDTTSTDAQATGGPELNAQTPVDRVKKFWGEFF